MTFRYTYSIFILSRFLVQCNTCAVSKKKYQMCVATCMLHTYSADSNKCAVWNNRVGYYIGLFGYYIKNYFLFNKFFWKNSEKNNRACTLIRDCRVGTYWNCKLNCLVENIAEYHLWLSTSFIENRHFKRHDLAL